MLNKFYLQICKAGQFKLPSKFFMKDRGNYRQRCWTSPKRRFPYFFQQLCFSDV